MSKITVTTIAGATSGADANKVKIESGDTLEVVTNATVGGTLAIAGHGSVGNAGTVAASRALTVVGATDGTGSSILVGYNSSLTPKFSVRDDGYVNVTNGLNLADGNLSVASGHGIDFSAGGNAAGMTSELLDDYEEGTFTPNVYGAGSNNSTWTTKTGEYTRIGNTVTCQIRIDHGNSGTANGNLTLSGLPFAPAQANATMSIGIWGANPSAQVGNVFGGSLPTLYKGGTNIQSQISFFTATLVYKTS